LHPYGSQYGGARLARLPLGYFGASTGAAAALLAAARQPYRVGAVVSRGGRPDLAASALHQVKAPTLLIVGGADDVVLKVNRAALAWLDGGGPHQLAVIPGATHLFEEPGALEEAARLAGDWFSRFSRTGSFSPSNPLAASSPARIAWASMVVGSARRRKCGRVSGPTSIVSRHSSASALSGSSRWSR